MAAAQSAPVPAATARAEKRPCGWARSPSPVTTGCDLARQSAAMRTGLVKKRFAADSHGLQSDALALSATLAAWTLCCGPRVAAQNPGPGRDPGTGTQRDWSRAPTRIAGAWLRQKAVALDACSSGACPAQVCRVLLLPGTRAGQRHPSASFRCVPSSPWMDFCRSGQRRLGTGRGRELGMPARHRSPLAPQPLGQARDLVTHPIHRGGAPMQSAHPGCVRKARLILCLSAKGYGLHGPGACGRADDPDAAALL